MTIEPIELYDPPASFSIRWIVYIHLAGVVYTASLVLADYGRLFSSAFSDWYESSFHFNPITELLIVGILFGCPLLMFFNLFKPSLNWNQKVIGAVAEFALTLGNLFVIISMTSH